MINLRVKTSSTLNFREYYRIGAKVIKSLPDGTQVQGTDITAVGGDYTWRLIFVNGVYGWAADNYLVPDDGSPAPTPVPVPVPNKTAMWGINIDPDNPVANPPTSKLKGCAYVRFVLKAHDQNRSIEQAFAFYDPIIANYRAQGTQVILILSQSMNADSIPWQGSGSWDAYRPNFANACASVAAHYGGNVVYEIWNEQDIEGQPTSVYVPPDQYGKLLRASISAIAGRGKVIVGGLAGPDPIAYLRACGDISGVNGIGIHPYGRVVYNIPGLPNSGLLSAYLNNFKTAFNKPLWITEYGIARVDVYNQALWPKIAEYMKSTFDYLKTRTDVPAAVWFAWADSQDNAGIVHDDQTPKGAIYSQFFANVTADTVSASTPVTSVPTPTPTVPPVVVTRTADAPNIGPNDTRIGMHIASNAPGQQIIDAYSRAKAAGKPFACATVISDTDLANQLADFTTVMYRMVWSDTEYYDPSMLDGLTPDQAETLGRSFYLGKHHEYNVKANKAQFLKCINERGFHAVVGNEFWIGMMKAAEAENRKLAIYGDSMSSVTPEAWQIRLPSLRYAFAHGHAVTVNAYGPTKADGSGDNKPVSGPEGFQWFGGWPIELYKATPADARPLLIIGETGSSDSTRPRAFDVAADAAAYDKLLRPYPYILGFSYYTLGQWVGKAGASLDYAIPAFENAVTNA